LHIAKFNSADHPREVCAKSTNGRAAIGAGIDGYYQKDRGAREGGEDRLRYGTSAGRRLGRVDGGINEIEFHAM
jgi:hypothetical protein